MANSNNDVVAHVTQIVPYNQRDGATPDRSSGFLVWDFDSSTDEYLYIDCRMRGWDGSSDIKVRFPWMSTSATSGKVEWEIAFWRLADAGDDVDSGWAGATPQAVIDDAVSPSGDFIYAEKVFTSGQIDGTQEGECFRLRFMRDVSTTSNMSGDAELLAHLIEILADV